MSNMVPGVPDIPDPLDRLWTHRDLDDAPDDGNRYEVIDGVLHVTPSPTTWHQRVIAKLVAILDPHLEAGGLGEVFAAGLKVVLDEMTGVEPDVVYVAREQAACLLRDGHHGPPALVVEVLSSKHSLDTRVKLEKYARAGIPWYWIVDPEAMVLWEYRLEGASYAACSKAEGDGVFQPALFPGLSIPLARLWGVRPG